MYNNKNKNSELDEIVNTILTELDEFDPQEEDYMDALQQFTPLIVEEEDDFLQDELAVETELDFNKASEVYTEEDYINDELEDMDYDDMTFDDNRNLAVDG